MLFKITQTGFVATSNVVNVYGAANSAKITNVKFNRTHMYYYVIIYTTYVTFTLYSTPP
jgi:hypothetical protein